MSSRRRKSREAAVQALYAMALSGLDRHEATLRIGAMHAEDLRKPDEMASRLLSLVEKNADEIDATLDVALKGWVRERLAATDSALLRLGVAEILYCDDVPGPVTINEYIELARAFGDEESPGFINGVLDRVLRDHPKSPRR